MQNDPRLVTQEILTFFANAEPEGGPRDRPFIKCFGGPGPFVTTSRSLIGEGGRRLRSPWLEGDWQPGHPAWGWDPGATLMERVAPLGNAAPMSECRTLRNAGRNRAPQFYLRVRSIHFSDEDPETIRGFAKVEAVTEGRSGRFFDCEIWKRFSQWDDLLCVPADGPLGHPGG